MKILVDREDIVTVWNMLYTGAGNNIEPAQRILTRILKDNPEPNLDERFVPIEWKPCRNETTLGEICFKTHHSAILEILDIMMDSKCNRGWNRSTVLETRLKALKAKLVGEK
jgi:hypothetical protein